MVRKVVRTCWHYLFFGFSPSSTRGRGLSSQSNAASLRLAVAGIFNLVFKPNAFSDFVNLDASVLKGSDMKKNVWSARIIWPGLYRRSAGRISFRAHVGYEAESGLVLLNVSSSHVDPFPTCA
jgi:hypothetical protein